MRNSSSFLTIHRVGFYNIPCNASVVHKKMDAVSKKKINLVKGLSAYSCHLVWYKVRLKNDRNAGNMARANAHLTEWHFVLENKVGFYQTKVSVDLQRQIVCCFRSFHVA